jgi:heme-degrading monooxygenase HmoA
MEGKALLNGKSYYAVIFTSIQSEVNKDYEKRAELMISLAKKQPGFLMVGSALSNGIGVTVAYWETEESIRNWKNNEKHLVARHKGRSASTVIIALHSSKENMSLIAGKK